jgi:hypothetical protein
MNARVRKIEVDVETSDLLEARAAALGISLSALLAEIAENLGPDSEEPVAPRISRLDPGERDRLLAGARDYSRSLRDDAGEQALLDEVESIQAENLNH